MEDVEITDVSDDDFPQIEKAPLQNQDLTFLNQTVSDILSVYGWYLLALTLVVYLLIQYLSKRRSHLAPKSAGPQTQQDAALVVSQREQMEAARQKMQEEQDIKAAEFRERQKQKEEEKSRQKIEMWESMQQGKSYKGNAKLPQATEDAATSELKAKANKKPSASGYNPLSGQGGGGSTTWRPNRRGPSSGG